MHLKPHADNTIILKSAREIEIMREAGAVVAAVADACNGAAKAGMTTRDLDDIAAKLFREADAESTALGYFGYPGHICVSVNEEVVHGIPGQRRLKQGDLIKCDIAARYRGYVADTTTCFILGGASAASAQVRELMEVTEAAMFLGIQQARPGNRLTDIGAAIEEHVQSHGLSIVKDFVGHGVGRNMHEAPQVPHYGPGGRGPVLREGMCLAIEPQVNLGSPRVRMLADGWTAVTVDGSFSAHFEHTVAVTADGPDVLTLAPTDERLARFLGRVAASD